MKENNEEKINTVSSKNETFLKQIKDYLPLASALLIISVFAKIYLIYSFFNIPIKYFFSLSELIVQAADDLFKILCTACIFSIVGYSFFAITMKAIKKRSVAENKESIEKAIVSERKTLSTLEFVSALLVLVMTLSYLVIELFDTLSLPAKVKFIGTMVFSFFFLRVLIFSIPKVLAGTLSKAMLITTVLLPIIAFFFQFEYTANEMIRIKGGKYQGTLIKTDKGDYTTIKDTIFVGKSEKYCFLYSKLDSTSIIVSNDEITSLMIKQRHVSIDR